MMRVAIGGISQESNSFSQVRCDLDFFRRRGKIYFAEGDAILAELTGTLTQVGGSLKAAREDDVVVVPTFAAQCISSGVVVEEAWQWMLDRILAGLQAAGPVDAVLLAMHGATISDAHDDATGYVIEQVRRQVGPGVPIGVSLDLHANPYPIWTELADVLISFHTYPHLEKDLFATGYDVAKLIFRRLRGEVQPVTNLARVPMLIPPENCSTLHDGTFAQMQRQVRQMVDEDDRLLAISLLPVQPQLDLPDLGFSALVITDGEPALGQQIARDLVERAWDRRHEFDVEFIPPERAIQMALEAPGRPVVLSDVADGVGGGSAGDGTHVLRSMLDAGLTVPTMLTCIDPEAVQEAIAAGFGAAVTLSVGGKRDPAFNTPVVVTGRVRTISDASYRAYGMPVKMGPCVVLEIGAIDLLLISNTVHVINPWVYRAVGLEPTQAKIVLVKSPAQFREEFEPIAAEIILVGAPGACSSNFTTLPYRRIRRPLYPWDDER